MPKVKINKRSTFINHLGCSLLPYILLHEIELEPMCLYRLRQFINKKYKFNLTLSTYQSVLNSLLKLNYLTKDNSNPKKKLYYITNEGILTKRSMNIDLVNLLKLLLNNN